MLALLHRCPASAYTYPSMQLPDEHAAVVIHL
jgi:hypothetical protein